MPGGLEPAAVVVGRPSVVAVEPASANDGEPCPGSVVDGSVVDLASVVGPAVEAVVSPVVLGASVVAEVSSVVVCAAAVVVVVTVFAVVVVVTVFAVVVVRTVPSVVAGGAVVDGGGGGEVGAWAGTAEVGAAVDGVEDDGGEDDAEDDGAEDDDEDDELSSAPGSVGGAISAAVELLSGELEVGARSPAVPGAAVVETVDPVDSVDSAVCVSSAIVGANGWVPSEVEDGTVGVVRSTPTTVLGVAVWAGSSRRPITAKPIKAQDTATAPVTAIQNQRRSAASSNGVGTNPPLAGWVTVAAIGLDGCWVTGADADRNRPWAPVRPFASATTDLLLGPCTTVDHCNDLGRAASVLNFNPPTRSAAELDESCADNDD